MPKRPGQVGGEPLLQTWSPREDQDIDSWVHRFLASVTSRPPEPLVRFLDRVPPRVRPEVAWRCHEEQAIQRFFRRGGTRQLPPPSVGVGDRLGGFLLVECLGEGGMGTVFRARQDELDRDVAVKIIRADVAHLSEVASRFRREATLVARLDHPGVIGIHHFGEERGVPYIVMELVRGPTLASTLEALKSGMPPHPIAEKKLGSPQDPGWFTRVASFVADLVTAVAHAHAHGIAHRDIKPSNVILGDEGNPRLADFGLALQEGDSRMTRGGFLVGTVRYLSPEALRGTPVNVLNHDLWALGVLLYELLVLRHPHERHDGAPGDSATREGEIVPPRNVDPRIPRELEWIVLCALAREPADRYASASSMESDLRRFIEGGPVVAARRFRSRWRLHLRRFRARYALVMALVGLVYGAGHWMSGNPPPEVPSHLASGRISMPAWAGSDPPSISIVRLDPAGKQRQEVLLRDVALPLQGVSVPAGIVLVTARFIDGRRRDVVSHVAEGSHAFVEIPFAEAGPSAESEMVLIPAGEVVIGGDVNDFVYPRSVVQLSFFWIDRTEVTCADYRRFLDAHPGVRPPSTWERAGGYDTAWDRLPVIGVSWNDARRYAEWQGKRLPTWEEWQAAARGPRGLRYPWGDEPGEVLARAVVGRGSATPWFEGLRPAGSCPMDRSPHGVLDTFGNVVEWTSSPFRNWHGGRIVINEGMLICGGFEWRAPFIQEQIQRKNFDRCTSSPPTDNGNGFRCAKSAP